jgi:hypothetical protein
MVPTPVGIGAVYHGWDVQGRRGLIVPVIPESYAVGDDLKWAKLADKLANERGESLYEKIGGGSNPLACEPVAVFFNKTDAYVWINFRYQNLERQGTGQYLAAFEFSRSLREYRRFHAVYHNYAFSPRITQAFSESLPVIKLALDLVFR